jgi:hypothetical protein
MESKETLKWLSKRFGISEEEIVWYNSGICYSRIGVTTRDAAEKVSKAVQGGTANGGLLDGMPLGGISESHDKNGNVIFDVTC